VSSVLETFLVHRCHVNIPLVFRSWWKPNAYRNVHHHQDM